MILRLILLAVVINCVQFHEVYCDEIIPKGNNLRIAIIGAGVTGLSAARHSVDQNHTVDVFEQTGKVGGIWVYDEKVGLDEDGAPIHTSMYQNLSTNLPKELMEYADLSYPENITESFIPQEDVLEYIEKYAHIHNLEKYIKFHNQVTKIESLPNDKWKIYSFDFKNKQQNEGIYDAVIICNGHHIDPRMPNIPGMDTFKGNWIHSHNYRTPKPYEDKVVLIVGVGPSGYDIAHKISKVAKKVIISYSGNPFHKLAPSIISKPRIALITNHSVIFNNTEEIDVDAIIYCTGYNYSYSFLSKNVEIEVDNNWVKPLYKHLININHPTMAFIGITIKTAVFPLGEHQAKFFLSYLNGNFNLTKEQMLDDYTKDIIEREALGVKKSLYHVIGPQHQNEYLNSLSNIGKLQPIKPVIDKIFTYHYSFPHFITNFKIINDTDFKIISQHPV